MNLKTKCEKCGFESSENKIKFGVPLCTICNSFAPFIEQEFNEYINEKIPEEKKDVLDFFRKYFSIKQPQKKGMIYKASQGELMSRAPFGYKIVNKKLIPAENFREIEEIFNEFLNEKISLNKLAKKHNLSVNGLKKILKNFTYIGKIKFNKQIHQGNHQPIISNTLFNHVQNKLNFLSKKN